MIFVLVPAVAPPLTQLPSSKSISARFSPVLARLACQSFSVSVSAVALPVASISFTLER